MVGASIMQKYIKNDLSEIRYFEDDVIVGDWLTLKQYRQMTEDEIDRHENPEKYLSDDEKSQLNRERMVSITKREFRKKLRDAKIFDQAEAYVRASGDGYLEDAWDYADFFDRLDPFILQASEALGLTPEQVDNLWISE